MVVLRLPDVKSEPDRFFNDLFSLIQNLEWYYPINISTKQEDRSCHFGS